MAHLVQMVDFRGRTITTEAESAVGLVTGVGHSVDLDKCVTTCIHHCSIIQTVLTASSVLCALPLHPSLSSSLFLVLYLFQNVTWLESYIMQTSHISFFHFAIGIEVSCLSLRLYSSFLFSAE